jgi:electron transfer flavoprotein beta subunit
MKIVVCIKQVPGTTEVKMNPETNTLIREGIPNVINPFDLYAVEEALRLKERFGGSVVTVCMGPGSAADQLKETVELGVDEVYLISNRAFAGSDTLATAYTLAKAIEKIGDVDLVICGKQAIDGDTAQVGPEIAENLDWPHVTYVRKVNDVTSEAIVVERMTDDGYEKVEMKLPALLTVVKEINEPRLPSIKGKMRAKKTEVPVWGPDELGVEPSQLGLNGSPTQVWKTFIPDHHVEAEIFEGEISEQVKALVQRLLEKNIVSV